MSAATAETMTAAALMVVAGLALLASYAGGRRSLLDPMTRWQRAMTALKRITRGERS